MSKELREAAQQALEALDSALGAVDGHYYDAVVPSANIAADALRTALAESERDWSLLEATQESLREHMAEIQRLRAALAQPATIAEWWAAKQAASGEPVAQYSDIVSDGGFDPRNAAPQPVPAPAASGEPADLIAGALYDLMGYLTTRDETIRLGATEGATPAADALVAFAAKRGLSLDNPAISDWPSRIATAQPAFAPLTDEQIDMITAEQWGRGLGAPYAAYRAYARAIEAAHGIGTSAKEAP